MVNQFVLERYMDHICSLGGIFFKVVLLFRFIQTVGCQKWDHEEQMVGYGSSNGIGFCTYELKVESTLHLLGHYFFIARVCCAVFSGLGVNFVNPRDLFHFNISVVLWENDQWRKKILGND